MPPAIPSFRMMPDCLIEFERMRSNLHHLRTVIKPPVSFVRRLSLSLI